MMQIKRRSFLTLLGTAAAAWPLGAGAQQGGRMRRVGVLFGGQESDPQTQSYAAVFREELAKHGLMILFVLLFTGASLTRRWAPAIRWRFFRRQ
jgi:putative ABC transport system substrate-binding protein